MMKGLRIATLILLAYCTLPVSGQDRKTELELDEFLQHLNSAKVDTIVILKSGCMGCNVEYDDSLTIRNAESIYVFTQQHGKYNLTVFDDVHSQKSFMVDTCSLFDFACKNKVQLQKKDLFYKTEMQRIKTKAGFLPPRQIHYSYEELTILFPGFKYNLEIVNDIEDGYGFNREKENWFILSRQIIDMLYYYLKQEKK